MKSNIKWQLQDKKRGIKVCAKLKQKRRVHQGHIIFSYNLGPLAAYLSSSSTYRLLHYAEIHPQIDEPTCSQISEVQSCEGTEAHLYLFKSHKTAVVTIEMESLKRLVLQRENLT